MAPGLQMRSRSRKSCCLISRSSAIASTTRSTSASASRFGCPGHPPEHRLGVLGGHPALLDRPRGAARERGLHPGHLVLTTCDEGHGVPGLGEDLDDARRHRARPDDAHGGHRPQLHTRGRSTRGRVRVGHDRRRARLLVGVEPPAALAPEHPRADHLLDDRARGVQAVAALLVHRVEDLVGGVEADEVEQREGAHRVAAAEAHRRVEVLARGVAALEHRHRVVQVAEEQRVGDEAGLVADDDRLLAQPLRECLDVLEDVIGGDDRADHLDELLHGRRVEEVHADDALGVRGRDGDLGDRQRRRVRREDGVGRDDRVDLAEQLLLEVEVLRHGLDDELAGGEVTEVAREGDPGVERVVLLLGHLAAGQRPTGAAAENGLAVLDGGGVDLDRDDVDPVAGEHLHDPRTHRPEPDHTNRGEVTRHARDPVRGLQASRPLGGVTLLTRAPCAHGWDARHPHHAGCRGAPPRVTHQSCPAATSSASMASRSRDGRGGIPTSVGRSTRSQSSRSSWS